MHTRAGIHRRRAAIVPDAFDLLLATALFWIAWQALHSRDLFKAVVLFITFGLLMALAWVRLGAPDIALAEGAIGAGITGALLLDAVRQLGDRDRSPRPSRATLVAAAALATLIGVLLAAVALRVPAEPVSLRPLVTERLPDSGVTQPVTAVLLNFRAYDTWLELGVLLLAVVALLALRRTFDLADARPYDPEPVLAGLAAVLVPLMILAAGYLLWLGTHAAGGAFQAGAMLGGAGVLLRVAGYRSLEGLGRTLLRLALVSGFLAFLLVAVAVAAFGHHVLEYPRGHASTLIVAIEAAAALGIGCTLAALFTGATPRQAGRR
jgi:multisubunit Na+/H+ antiporter MnhB subunit